MKLRFMITGVALLGALAFTSCKKDHTCKCTTTFDGGDELSASTTIKDTKKKAEDACTALNSETDLSKTTCEIQ